jgi:hypothetical protein
MESKLFLPDIPEEKLKPTYFVFIPDENAYHDLNILLYNTETKQTTTKTGPWLVSMFPPPKNGFAMWGTPFGHLKFYPNLIRIATREEFIEKTKEEE